MKKANTDELRDKAKKYDNLHNEGGDGYNPYAAEIDRRAHATAQAEADRRAQTPQGRIDALYRRIERECGFVAREWGDTIKDEGAAHLTRGTGQLKFTKMRALKSSLYAKIAEIKKEIEAEFMAKWDIETTKTRRVEWNEFVETELTPLNGTSGGYKLMYKKENELGWKLADLKKAVKTHNL